MPPARHHPFTAYGGRHTENLWIYGYIRGPTPCPGAKMLISRLDTFSLEGVPATVQTVQLMLVLWKLLNSQFQISKLARIIAFVKN